MTAKGPDESVLTLPERIAVDRLASLGDVDQFNDLNVRMSRFVDAHQSVTGSRDIALWLRAKVELSLRLRQVESTSVFRDRELVLNSLVAERANIFPDILAFPQGRMVLRDLLRDLGALQIDTLVSAPIAVEDLRALPRKRQLALVYALPVAGLSTAGLIVSCSSLATTKMGIGVFLSSGVLLIESVIVMHAALRRRGTGLGDSHGGNSN